MLRVTAMLLLILLTISHAVAGSKRAGEFDYYVLALSWSPSWCTLTGDAKGADQCDAKHDYGFTLHGLWPQYERGWPSFCATNQRSPSRQMTAGMVDIMGSDGLAWHQWDKHGRCSGLPAEEYYTVARQAFTSIKRPDVFRKLLKPMTLPASVVEAAFLEENPALNDTMVTITCKRGHFQEVRICLTRELEPRECGADVQRDCDQRVVLPPVR